MSELKIFCASVLRPLCNLFDAKPLSVLYPSLARLILSFRFEAALAQLVEHRIRNAGVACSSHASGTISSLTILFCYGPYVMRKYA